MRKGSRWSQALLALIPRQASGVRPATCPPLLLLQHLAGLPGPLLPSTHFKRTTSTLRTAPRGSCRLGHFSAETRLPGHVSDHRAKLHAPLVSPEPGEPLLPRTVVAGEPPHPQLCLCGAHVPIFLPSLKPSRSRRTLPIRWRWCCLCHAWRAETQVRRGCLHMSGGIWLLSPSVNTHTRSDPGQCDRSVFFGVGRAQGFGNVDHISGSHWPW